jgi:CRISPR-associated protein Cst1
MKQTYNSIDYEWLTQPTGDPFADIGGYVIKYLSEKHPEKDILELIMYLANVYIDRWNAGLHMFFLNSKITQNRFKTPEIKKEKTKEYFNNLLEGRIESKKGVCRITGRMTDLYTAGRDNSFLTGSGTFLNFHHGLDYGVMLSKEALIRFFFVPFGCEIIYDKIAVIGSNISQIVEYNVKNIVDQNCYNMLFKFTLRSKYSNTPNALFGFIDKLIMDIDNVFGSKDVSLTLFHFTNIGTAPTIDIHKVPSKVFQFYRLCLTPLLKSDWHKLIKASYIKYYGYKASYDSSSNCYVEQVKEISGIEKDMVERLQNDQSLNFELCQFGDKIDNKKNKEYIIFNAGEIDNWKKKKIFKIWKDTNPEIAKSLTEQTKKFKESKELRYNEEYFSYKWKNIIYEKLIREESIITYILKWSKHNKFNFKIVRYYQQILRNMNTKTIDLIEKLSDYIIENESEIKTNLSRLRTSNGTRLRSFIVRLIDKNYKAGNKDPLITLHDYVEYLFPVGTYKEEIRDLMLICVYQKLHEKEIQIDMDDSDDVIATLEIEDENEF